ncbi:hypothetical protein [Methylocystis sp. Sn-Cys]|uniref:HD domain-containing protein n=1 Tax=Methylocystis sp. Sn-Cys TaxID=1701263 RepID=UPI001920D7C4|nr:hypothetical protein [Methylocystis sp. Sn-Cys]MBL1258011.1 hypothetical protein [Methylocystis sp. Sn-Cys]
MTAGNNYLLTLIEGTEYEAPYNELSAKFSSKIHPNVVELGNGLDRIFLTDHGPEHIKWVIKQAAELCSQGKITMSAYEAYIVLIAAHLHDVGNALGRRGHTTRIDEIFQLIYGPLGFNKFDANFAEEIASTHGGNIKGSKDTLSTLDADSTFFGKPVKPQLLAAIIRLGDELSEAPYRANHLAIEAGKLPTGSEAYHIYAYGLHTTQIEAETRSIRLAFWLNEKYFMGPLEKDEGSVYLLDYIFDRTVKTFDEAVYCTKYMRGALFFDKVHVEVAAYDDRTKRRIKKVAYTLRQHGFPSRSQGHADIYELAPELKNYEGHGKLTGETLAKGLSEEAAR